MTVTLSERMAAVAALVTPGNRVADIGCDHAFLPIALCQMGRIPSALAMDVREGPLARAEEHILACGWDDRIVTRRSDGLEQLGEDEADTVLIAGMGGRLMCRILTGRTLPESVRELVLQPQSEAAKVRQCVRGLGFHIAQEDMVFEDGKYYPVIKALAGPAPEKEAARQELEDAFGPVLLENRHPVLFRWLERERDVTDDILARLDAGTAGAPSDARSAGRRRELLARRALIGEALLLYGQGSGEAEQGRHADADPDELHEQPVIGKGDDCHDHVNDFGTGMPICGGDAVSRAGPHLSEKL